jgi:gamma-glutamyltranspeptidase/glutathione hydrolase
MFTTRPELRGTMGMVASTHWLASAAGMAVLEQGGNAFDAAAAAGFVLQVVEPHLNGPGGEVPIILYSARLDDVVVINGQGPAPASASAQGCRELGLELVPGTGLLAACVPGAFDAWMLMLKEFGTLSPRAVLAAAIGYAASGYPVVPAISRTVAEAELLFREHWTSSAELYLGPGGPPRPGRLFRNRRLAATYERILAEAESAASREGQIDAARNSFYRGFVAEAIAAYVAQGAGVHSSELDHRGWLRAGDLAGFEASIEPPATLEYRGYTVCKTDQWGQGPVFLQQLALLAGFDIDSMEPGGTELVHTVVECAKLAFADREAWYGDPSHDPTPVQELLEPSYADARRKLIGEEASLELRPGAVGGRQPRLPSFVTAPPTAHPAPGTGEPTLARDTCHVDVADRYGNLVSATPSGGWLQGSPVIPELGFPLGTRAQMFWLEGGLPNSLAGSKRPRTTLSPSLVLRDGDPYLAFGTPGGDQQDQWSLLFFLNHIHFGMDLQAAIDAPAFHSEHFPSSFYPRASRLGAVRVERRVRPEVVRQLRARGHDVIVEGPWSLGRVSAAGREADGVLKAAANARGMQGYAVGR